MEVSKPFLRGDDCDWAAKREIVNAWHFKTKAWCGNSKRDRRILRVSENFRENANLRQWMSRMSQYRTPSYAMIAAIELLKAKSSNYWHFKKQEMLRNFKTWTKIAVNCSQISCIYNIMLYLHTCARSHSRSNVKTLLGRLGGRGTQTRDLLRIWLFLVLFHRPVLL